MFTEAKFTQSRRIKIIYKWQALFTVAKDMYDYYGAMQEI